MQNIIGIYKITNLINGKIYIGKSLNIKARIQAHKSYYKTNAPSKNNKYWHNKLYTAMREFGIDNFSFEVIEECKSEELDQKEIYWINYYDSYNNGYNMTLGGDGGSPHETNARALLTLDDVINIRTLYNNLIPSKEVYPQYQDRISLRGFQKVWRGETWTDVMPEVYTEENKLFHKTKAKGSKNLIIEFYPMKKFIMLGKLKVAEKIYLNIIIKTLMEKCLFQVFRKFGSIKINTKT